MLLLRRNWRELVRIPFRQSKGYCRSAASMGEGCCGTSGSAAPTEQLNGMHLGGNAAPAASNNKAAPPKSHREAAEELQGWIKQRLELFDKFAERQKQLVSDHPLVSPLDPRSIDMAVRYVALCTSRPCQTAQRSCLSQSAALWLADAIRLVAEDSRELSQALSFHSVLQTSQAQDRNEPIRVSLPDGGEKAGVRGVTTPLDIANSLSKSLAKKVVVADVDGGKWDLFRPLEDDCQLQLFEFSDPKGKDVSHLIL